MYAYIPLIGSILSVSLYILWYVLSVSLFFSTYIERLILRNELTRKGWQVQNL